MGTNPHCNVPALDAWFKTSTTDNRELSRFSRLNQETAASTTRLVSGSRDDLIRMNHFLCDVFASVILTTRDARDIYLLCCSKMREHSISRFGIKRRLKCSCRQQSNSKSDNFITASRISFATHNHKNIKKIASNRSGTDWLETGSRIDSPSNCISHLYLCGTATLLWIDKRAPSWFSKARKRENVITSNSWNQRRYWWLVKSKRCRHQLPNDAHHRRRFLQLTRIQSWRRLWYCYSKLHNYG